MSKKRQKSERKFPSKVIIFSCILGLIAVAVVGVAIINSVAESRFVDEMAAADEAFSSGDNKKIEEIVNRTVSSGDYAKIEKALKSYIGDVIANINGIDEVSNSEAVSKSLEGEYLGKNRNNLGAVISQLKEASGKVDSLTADYKKLYNEESVKDYIKDQNLNENFTALFTENAKLFYDDKDLRNDYESMLKVLSDTIHAEIKAVEYLDKNKSSWKIENNEILFMNSAAANAYSEILQSVANS